MITYQQFIKEGHTKEEAQGLINTNPCTFCSLQNNQICIKAKGYGAEHPKFMVVSDYIRRSWATKSMPFSGNVVSELQKVFKASNINPAEVYFTSLVKCASAKSLKYGEDTKPKKDNITFCSAYLEKEIADKKPQVIIACGQIALEYFFPKLKMAEKRCQVLKDDKHNCLVVPIYNPEAMTTTAEFDRIITKAFQQAYNAVYAPEKLKFPDVKYVKVTTLDMLRQVHNRIKEVDRIAYDLETNGVVYRTAKILSVGVSWAKNTGVSWPIWVKDQEACDKALDGLKGSERLKMASKLDHDPFIKKFWKDDEFEEVMAITKDIFENTKCKKGGHNTFFDNLILHYNGIEVNNYTYDTMVMKHLLDEDSEKSLDYCSWIYTDKGGYKMEKEKYLKSDKSNFANIPLDVLLEYNAGDAACTYELYDVFKPEILKEGLAYELAQIRIPLQKALMEACIAGMPVNMDYVRKTREDINKQLKELEEQLLPTIKKYYGDDVTIVSNAEEAKECKNPWNINSAQSLRDLFFNKLKCKSSGTTASGSQSTDESALLKLQRKGVKEAELILKRKKLFKYRTTYLDDIENILDENNRVHPSFSVTGTSSGRLSSSNPNCFSKDTEVLTDSGWKYFWQLTKEDKVAQWKDGEITFDYPLGYVKYLFNGKLCYRNSKYIGMCATPDHRCLVFDKDYKPFFTTAHHYKTGCYQLITAPYNKGTINLDSDTITVLVYANKYGAIGYNGDIEITISKGRISSDLEKSLKNINKDYEIEDDEKNNIFRILNGGETYQTIMSLTNNLRLSAKLFQLTPESRTILLDKFLALNNYNSTRKFTFMSDTDETALTIKTLLFFNGYYSRLKIVERRQEYSYTRGLNIWVNEYRLEIVDKIQYAPIKLFTSGLVRYEDYVYCVTMPYGTVVVKLGDKIMITGQCQQIPRDKTIKCMFQAPEGYEIGEVDFSQAELRVLAALSNDTTMIRIYSEDRDLHRELAMTAFHKKAEDITKEERTIAKTCFDENSMILTPNGYVKASDLGDSKVLDLNGKPQNQKHVFEKQPGYEIALSNGNVVHVTKNHKFKLFDKLEPRWVEANTLKVGDTLGTVKWSQYGGYIQFHVGKGLRTHTYEQTFTFNEGMAYTMGLYLSDGSISYKKDKTCGTLAILVKNENKKYVLDSLKSFGAKEVVYKDKDYSLVQVRTKALVDWVDTNFGRKSNKHIPDFMYQCPETVIKSFLSGLLDSDSTIGSRARYINTSKLLSMGVARLGSLMGYEMSFTESKYHTRINGKEYSGILYTVSFITKPDVKLLVKNSDFQKVSTFYDKSGWVIDKSEFVNSTWNGRHNYNIHNYLTGKAKKISVKAANELGIIHHKYNPVKVLSIKECTINALVMETDTHYFIGEGFESHNCNFLISYSGGPDTLKDNLEDGGVMISKSDAEKIIKTWHNKFKDASSYLASCGRRYIQSGFLMTPLGRKRHLNKVFADEYINSKHQREGSNFMIQSTAASLAFISLINISREVKKFGGRVISTVHDSILIEYPVEQRKNIAQICKKYTWVTYPFLNGLYMKSDLEAAKEWGNKKPVDMDTGEFIEED